jgi:hypothetical protein
MVSQYKRALYDALCYFEQRTVQNAIEPCAPKKSLIGDWHRKRWGKDPILSAEIRVLGEGNSIRCCTITHNPQTLVILR